MRRGEAVGSASANRTPPSPAQLTGMRGDMLMVLVPFVIGPDWTSMLPGAPEEGGNGSVGSSWCQTTPLEVGEVLVEGPGRPPLFATQILPLRTATLAMRTLKGLMKRGSPT